MYLGFLNLVVLYHFIRETLFHSHSDQNMFLINLLRLLLGNGCFADLCLFSQAFLLLIWCTNRDYFSCGRLLLFCLWFLENGLPCVFNELLWLGHACPMSGFLIQSRGLVSPQNQLTGWFVDWQEPGWVTLVVHLLLNCPAWLCLKVIQGSWSCITATAGGPSFDVAFGEGCFYLDLVSRGQGQRSGGCSRHPACQVVKHSHVATSG